MIRVEALWLLVVPLDMRAGMDTIPAQVVQVFGEAWPHQAYLFVNRRGIRMKVLIHDGQGIQRKLREKEISESAAAPSDPTASQADGDPSSSPRDER